MKTLGKDTPTFQIVQVLNQKTVTTPLFLCFKNILMTWKQTFYAIASP